MIPPSFEAAGKLSEKVPELFMNEKPGGLMTVGLTKRLLARVREERCTPPPLPTIETMPETDALAIGGARFHRSSLNVPSNS
jgi:hypothetical protein